MLAGMPICFLAEELEIIFSHWERAVALVDAFQVIGGS